jgi:hypothetical protein
MSTAATIELVVIVAVAVVLNGLAIYGVYGMLHDRSRKH